MFYPLSRKLTVSAALLLAILACTISPHLNAATVTIGSTGCNYIGLQFALDQLATMPGPHVLKMRTQTFSVPDGLHLDASSTNWELRGGYSSCSDANPAANQRTIIDASGGSNGTAFRIDSGSPTSHSVTLRGITVTGGTSETDLLANPEGGGLEVRGRIGLILRDKTRIEDNASGKGGGIYIKGRSSSERASLQVIGGTQIIGNTAQADGGGIYCDNDTSIFFDDGEASFNVAEERGGGVYLHNACRFDSLVSPGTFTGIANNEAGIAGGAIYAISAEDLVIVGAGNAPFWVLNNTADSDGGGLYLVNNSSTLAAVTLLNTVFHGNRAVTSSAFGAFGAFDIDMRPRSSGATCDFFGVPYGACSAVIGNISSSPASFFGTFATYYDSNDIGNLSIRDTAFVDNEALRLITAASDHGANLEQLIVTGNHVGDTLLLVFRPSQANAVNSLTWSTVTGNSTDTPGQTSILSHGDSSMDVTGSIFYNPGFVGRRSSTGPVTHGGCLLVDSNASWPSTPVPPLVGNPALSGSLDLQISSPAVDVCSSSSAPAVDFRGNPRVVDQPTRPNLHGPVDLGVYELPYDDTIFRNGFE